MRLDDNYFLLDCGGDGDCLFHVISEALNLDKISRSNTGKKANKAVLYDAKDIRKIAADSVTRKNFRDIICAYTLKLKKAMSLSDLESRFCGNSKRFKRRK